MGTDLPVALSVLRVVRGWSQEDLAKASGVRVSSLSEYERGKKIPDLRTLQKVVPAMGYPLSALDEAEIFVYRIRLRKLELEPGVVHFVEAPAPELGLGAPAAVRWEIEQASASAGRVLTRLLRLGFLLLARLWERGPGAGATPLQGRDAEADVEMKEIYAILTERFDGGETDTAERHNEQQP